MKEDFLDFLVTYILQHDSSSAEYMPALGYVENEIALTCTHNLMKDNLKQLHTDTANAFKDKIKSYDKKSQWVYTFEAKGMLNRLEASLTRLYDNNCLSQKDFEKFDSMLLKDSQEYLNITHYERQFRPISQRRERNSF